MCFRVRGVDNPGVLHFFDLVFVEGDNTIFPRGEIMRLGKIQILGGEIYFGEVFPSLEIFPRFVEGIFGQRDFGKIWDVGDGPLDSLVKGGDLSGGEIFALGCEFW